MDALRAPIGAGVQRMIEDWRVRGAPFVVAAGSSETGLRLGLATPDKHRIGFHLDRTAVCRIAPPPTLEESAIVAPRAWRTRLDTIGAAAHVAKIAVSVYGSLAWTYRSSVAFVSVDSDLDLLLTPCGATLAQIYAFLGELLATDGAPRLDGELLLTDVAVAWREFERRPERLLVKGTASPHLQRRCEVETRFPKGLA